MCEVMITYEFWFGAVIGCSIGVAVGATIGYIIFKAALLV